MIFHNALIIGIPYRSYIFYLNHCIMPADNISKKIKAEVMINMCFIFLKLRRE